MLHLRRKSLKGETLMAEKPRLISSEPRFLNLLDEFLAEAGIPKEGFLGMGLAFMQDLCKFMRNRDVIISTLGSILLSEAMILMIAQVKGRNEG